ncbi:hypothetical protein JTE90_005198 [Oedothorax gibbosus]|uniref:Uncharacterized protein n=1 Tax=Oedothorax gibbosus TaxID=931172 RepID=A0AAV6ULP7_9ARAC|nr:hypothetical protein JTE90_005198 [Oedothorax gibbosus]
MSRFLGGSSVESIASLDGGKKKKKRKGGLFSRFAASVSSLAPAGRTKDAAAQTTPPPPLAHRHTQTDDPPPTAADSEGESTSDERPLLPALRTDSPLRHSPKSVHFNDEEPEGASSSDEEWPPPPPPCDLEGLDDLLRNLDILGEGAGPPPRDFNPLFPVGGPGDLDALPVLPSPPAFFFMAATRKEQPSSGNQPENDGFEFHPPPVTYSQKSHTAEGAVLLEERVLAGVDGAVVRERVFGLPLVERGREEVRTTRFVPAPPKYEGIGPTDDGLPLAPRQMVQKEHDWYKSMFKTLHPADDADDEPQVVVRYHSSPEPEKSTTEHFRTHPRIEHLFPSTPSNTASPPQSEVGRQQGGDISASRRPRATALFPFQAMHDNELPLSKGDEVSVSRLVDANWLEGTHQGRHGIFPANHVKVVFPDRAMCGRVLHPFQAQSPLELSVEKNELVRVERCSADAAWWGVRGARGGRGLVPAASIRLESTHGEGKDEAVKRAQNTLIEPLMCVAVYEYAPVHEDELELRAGDRVRVVEQCADGWYAGTCARTRQTGLFPGNYVEPLLDEN